MNDQFLLDANLLIALTIREHEHHERASRWAEGKSSLFICPIVEGALVRFFVRIGERASTATEVLKAIRHTNRCEFLAEELSYSDIDLGSVRGHRQVTDAYLVALATLNGMRLATFDAGLVQLHPTSTVLIPK